jgi:hypothetical protein
VYRNQGTDKVGYVSAKDRKTAREAAAEQFGGNASDYFAASASR